MASRFLSDLDYPGPGNGENPYPALHDPFCISSIEFPIHLAMMSWSAFHQKDERHSSKASP
jgi:hypothetical protein